MTRLVEKLGNEEVLSQKKILCFNKVYPSSDLLEHELSFYPKIGCAITRMRWI